MIALDLPDELVERLARLVPCSAQGSRVTGIVAGRRDGGQYVLRTDGVERHGLDADAAVEVVLETINRMVLGQCRDFAVHAGAVAREGAVLALPADSGTGKTTMVAALLQQGWDYVSDEALVLTRTGVVRAYPKWLSVHAWTLERLGLAAAPPGRGERPVAVAELSSTAAQDDLRVAHVLLLSRGGRTTELQDVPRAEAAAELLRCSFNHYRDPVGSLSLAAAVLAGAQAHRLIYHDPVVAASRLAAVLG